MNRVVVRTVEPRRAARLIVIATAALLAVGWGLFEYGRHRAGVDFVSNQEKAERLAEANQELEATLRDLREKQAVLDRHRQIESEAYKQLETTVAGLHDELAELKGELAFYRGIVTARDTPGGMSVDKLEIAANGVERGYHYKLVLTQVLKSNTVASGSVAVLIEGNQGGRIKVLNLGDLVTGTNKELLYKFKYFQNLEGNFQLPQGFIPIRVMVKVTPRDQRNQQVEKVFDWPAA